MSVPFIREFTVYAVKTKHGYVLYFVDDTYYKAINREFNDRRPCVCILAFDNREELSHDNTGIEDARIASEVEAALRRWAVDMGGFLKRMSGGDRYVMMTDEARMEQLPTMERPATCEPLPMMQWLPMVAS